MAYRGCWRTVGMAAMMIYHCLLIEIPTSKLKAVTGSVHPKFQPYFIQITDFDKNAYTSAKVIYYSAHQATQSFY